MISNISDIENYLDDKSFKKIFLLTGTKSFEFSGAKKILSKILKKKETKYFHKKSTLPVFEELIKIIKEIRFFKPDLILAVGGGSVIDYAKISNVVELKNNLKFLIKSYSYPYKKKFSKLAVIPTTAGSGAEVTSNAVIYLEGKKYSFESEMLIPDNFFLIPEFVISASNKLKASAGFDAIAQAVESLLSKKSTRGSVMYAKKSLKISTKSFIPFLEKTNIKNSAEMLIASNLAGKAINVSKTISPHAISYPFTSIYNLSHGHAVSLFFENFIKFNFDNLNKSETSFNIKKRYDLIFKLFGIKNIFDFENKLSFLKKKANLEDDLIKLNININKNTESIIRGVNLLRLSNNPVRINKKNIIDIINQKKP